MSMNKYLSGRGRIARFPFYWLLMACLVFFLPACQAAVQQVEEVPLPATSAISPTALAVAEVEPTNTPLPMHSPTSKTAAATATETPPPSPVTTDTPTPTHTTASLELSSGQTVLFTRDDALWRVDIDGNTETRLTPDGFLGWNREEPDFRDTRPRLSPDGRFIAQLSSPASTRVLDLESGVEISIPAAWELAWSPDSQALAFAPLTSGIQSLWLADVFSGNVTELVSLEQPPSSTRIHNIAWSPDGSQIAFDCCFTERQPYDGFSDGLVQIITLDTGELVTAAETELGIAAGPPDFCWTEEGQFTMELQPGMVYCSRNFLFEPLAIISPENLSTAWEAEIDPQGNWLNSRITVTGMADGRLLWEQILPLSSYVVMAWSPDGRYLFVDDQAADSPIWRISSDGMELIEVVSDGNLLGVVPQWALALSGS